MVVLMDHSYLTARSTASSTAAVTVVEIVVNSPSPELGYHLDHRHTDPITGVFLPPAVAGSCVYVGAKRTFKF